MNVRKTTAINLRMSADINGLLRLAAARKHRILSNMLEYLVLRHCELSGLSIMNNPEAAQSSPRKQGPK